MSHDADLLFDILPWDSAFFSLRIGRLKGAALDADGAALLRRQALEEHMDCIYFLADPSSAASLDAAGALGMRAVDVRIDLVAGLAGRTTGPSGCLQARDALPSEEGCLADMAGRLHDATRFRNDPRFDQALVTEMYRLWLRRAFGPEGVRALASGPQGAPTGYCTYGLSGSIGRIELLGVETSSRGSGTGAKLVGAALDRMAALGAASAEVATQGGSRASLAVYQSAGFRVSGTGLWFHYWPMRVAAQP